MNQRFTQEMLIKHLYQETDVSEQQAIRSALKSDPALRQEYNKFSKMKELLNSEKSTPSDTSVRIILDHSKRSSKLEIV